MTGYDIGFPKAVGIYPKSTPVFCTAKRTVSPPTHPHCLGTHQCKSSSGTKVFNRLYCYNITWHWHEILVDMYAEVAISHAAYRLLRIWTQWSMLTCGFRQKDAFLTSVSLLHTVYYCWSISDCTRHIEFWMNLQGGANASKKRAQPQIFEFKLFLLKLVHLS